MKNILVPTDFSDISMKAAETAVIIAKKLKASIQLLHITDLTPGWNQLPTEIKMSDPKQRKMLMTGEAKLLNFAQMPLFKGIKVRTYLEGDVPFEQIVQFPEAHQSDLIVMGAYGLGETKKPAIGSTAQRVLRFAPCPVLFVKKKYIPVPLKTIVFASSFDEAVRPIINTLVEFSNYFKGTVHLIYVNTKQDFKVDEVILKLIQQCLQVEGEIPFKLHITNAESKEAGIMRVAKSIQADVIALTTHWHRSKKTYALGIAETLLLKSDIPIMSFLLKK
ncbi:universal stress protein [Chryseotalea sanaruensis]|uniref:Universal stress protein n=1 Tax=Chryseotalea sanaruensis TaxID=2482724 RepID=A0A401U6B8_9BACT|nr:universal stress protein [Chryseotalea sanaruensis]GCC50419.1 universal stress protein [Chryseotalea sanaruensis]